MGTDARTSIVESRRRAGRALAALVLTAGLTLGLTASSAQVASATIDPAAAEAQFLSLLNGARGAAGLGGLVSNPAIVGQARTWSSRMANTGVLAHDRGLVAQMNASVPTWTRVGENVGYGWSVPSLHDAFMASPGHRDNVLGAYNQVGVGVVVTGGGKIWVTFRFAQAALPRPAPTPPAPAKPAPPARPKGDTVGVRRSNAYYLRRSNSGGPADLAFGYGLPSDIGLMGDWNGDGVDTPGVYRNGTFLLRNSNSSGPAELVFNFGIPGDVPVTGDWNGDGTDTIGVVRGSVWHVRNSNSGGPASAAFGYGVTGDRPVTGDWNGDGTDTAGVYRSGTWYLRNTPGGGYANVTFAYGLASDTPVTGDWNGDGTDTIGVRRGNLYLLRNTNNAGITNIAFGYGWVSDTPAHGSL
jgi:uncharacterized protein YkwD